MESKRYQQLRASSESSDVISPPMAPCTGVFAYCLLLLGVALTVLCCVTSYWLVHDRPPPSFAGKCHQGLLATCYGDDCKWYFDVDMNEPLPDWFKATQGLMSVGLGLGLLALLIATLSLCCTCHSCNLNVPVCTLLLLSSVSMGVGIAVFGIKAKNEWDIDIEWSITDNGRFGWSFWVGIGAAALAMLTSAMYGCMGRKRD